jgi:outer membrane protein with beta-barrel domain
MLVLLTGNVLPAAAQTPDDGMIAVGADIGAFFPDDAFEDALTVDVFGEYYVTPRFSGRAMLAWTSPGVDGFTEDHFRQVKLLFNGVYNWEMGVWHPFVTAGAGAYFVRLHRENRPDPDGETRGGLNLGGGIEYFLNRLVTIKGELRWDVVSHPPGLPDATGVSLTIGAKHYF